ncbi:unnamed protein product [Sphagnum troendelagicum]|uniref:Uncharacterized protein n=1 Tax=Sphagnum troendelagicum TaxID=128251 RepID=A0ABP0TPU4_9BRYO
MSSKNGSKSGGNSVVAARPPLFTEVGKQARDLVYKGFVRGHMLVLSCLGPVPGSTITTTATIVDDITVGIISATIQEGNAKHELTFNTLSNKITASTMVTNLGVPGLTAGITTALPCGANDASAQVCYHHDIAALSAKVIGFKSRPELEFTANMGMDGAFMGGAIRYDTKSAKIGMSKVGIGYDAKEFSGSFMVDPLIEKSFDVHVARSLSPRCQMGAHIRHQTEKQLTSAKVAGSYQYDSQTILKGRLDEKGMVAALLQYSPSPPFATFSLLAEVNCRDLKQKPNIGLSFTVLGAAVIQ